MRREMVSLGVSTGKEMELWIIYTDVYSVGILTCQGSKPFKIHLWIYNKPRTDQVEDCVGMNEDVGGR